MVNKTSCYLGEPVLHRQAIDLKIREMNKELNQFGRLILSHPTKDIFLEENTYLINLKKSGESSLDRGSTLSGNFDRARQSKYRKLVWSSLS